MLNARSTVIEDIYADPRIPADAYRPTFVKSLAMVPIRRDAPIGAIGNYWATQRLPSEEEVAILQSLADTTSVALENAQLYSELTEKIRRLQVQEFRNQTQHDALEVFTRALAHDLREPVRALVSFSDMIASADVTADEAARYFVSIRRASRRMGMLIESVFQYTQLDDPEQAAKVACAMDRVLDGVREELSELFGQRTTLVTTGLPEVVANPRQISDVLKHLVSNALTHGGGAVTVRVNAEDRGGHWVFCVRDDGPGIGPEHIDKIFLPFRRLVNREDCAGLGLAICKRVVEAHGGRIWCESEVGNGAAFYFDLPKGDAAESHAEAAQADEFVPWSVPANDATFVARPANVLLVDDREDDIAVARVAIRRAKLELNLLVARSGNEALDLLRAMAAKDEAIDLTLLDINMPGMDGFELLERIRDDEDLRRLAVVMCTGSTRPKDMERAQTLGAAGYLLKPPSFARLKPILEQISTLRLDQEGETYRLLRAA